jgi:hypothetical protein
LGFLLTVAAISFVCFSGLFLWKMVRTKKRKDDDQHDFYREPIPVSPLVYAVILLLLATMAGLVWWMGQSSSTRNSRSNLGNPSFFRHHQSPLQRSPLRVCRTMVFQNQQSWGISWPQVF